MPSDSQPPADWSEADLALVKQGVGDKSGKPPAPAAEAGDATGEAPSGEQSGSVVTYFEAKGFGFLRPVFPGQGGPPDARRATAVLPARARDSADQQIARGQPDDSLYPQ